MVKTRATIALSLILLCLMTSSVVYLQPARAQYSGNITINADGSLTPSSAPIQKTGNAYILTSDLTGSITVNQDNALLNGNGHILIGQGYTPFGDLSLNQVQNVTVENFVIPYSGDTSPQVIGIQLTNTSNALVKNNTITGFEDVQAWNGGSFAAIDVEGGSSNIIVGNNLVCNLYGISLSNTSSNQVIANNVTGDVNFKFLYSTGIYVVNASSNLIYHNNFINSTTQAIVSDSANTWDAGNPIGGNYWSNYWNKYPDAAEIGNSTILNFQYMLDSQNKDCYPLQNPFSSTIYAIESAPAAISILSPINMLYNQSSIPLVLTLDEQTNWVGYSLDEKQNVTVTGNCTIANVTNGLHNVVVYANNTYGNIGVQTVSFTVEKPQAGTFGRTTIIAVIAVPVAIICLTVGLLLYRRHRKTIS